MHPGCLVVAPALVQKSGSMRCDSRQQGSAVWPDGGPGDLLVDLMDPKSGGCEGDDEGPWVHRTYTQFIVMVKTSKCLIHTQPALL